MRVEFRARTERASLAYFLILAIWPLPAARISHIDRCVTRRHPPLGNEGHAGEVFGSAIPGRIADRGRIGAILDSQSATLSGRTLPDSGALAFKVDGTGILSVTDPGLGSGKVGASGNVSISRRRMIHFTGTGYVAYSFSRPPARL
jgi:hypothetical protein